MRPQSQALFQLTDWQPFQLTLKIQTFWLKAGLQLGLRQDQDKAPFPALVFGNSPSTLWEWYLLLGITQSCWEPLNSNATNTGIHSFTRRHQEGLGMLLHCLQTFKLGPPLCLPQLGTESQSLSTGKGLFSQTPSAGLFSPQLNAKLHLDLCSPCNIKPWAAGNTIQPHQGENLNPPTDRASRGNATSSCRSFKLSSPYYIVMGFICNHPSTPLVWGPSCRAVSCLQHLEDVDLLEPVQQRSRSWSELEYPCYETGWELELFSRKREGSRETL